jgi:ribosome-binding factor A
MPKEYSRTQRVSELIRRELADIISTRTSDPRLSLVSITAVDISKDLKSAKVYVTQLGDNSQALVALENASRFLRRELSSRLSMKASPSLSFTYDHSVERGVALSRLIEEVNKNVPDGEA